MTLKTIPEYEGRRNCIYRDSLGNETVGIGHLVKPSDDDLFDARGCLTDGQVDLLYSQDLALATAGAISLVSNYVDQPDSVQQILINMTFNLGYTRLSKFDQFISFIVSKDYQSAAEDLITTLWYKQVGQRSIDIVDTLQSIGPQ